MKLAQSLARDTEIKREYILNERGVCNSYSSFTEFKFIQSAEIQK